MEVLMGRGKRILLKLNAEDDFLMQLTFMQAYVSARVLRMVLLAYLQNPHLELPKQLDETIPSFSKEGQKQDVEKIGRAHV